MRGAVGRAMNPDGAYGLQCVDVADDYAAYIFPGVSWSTSFGHGNANQHWPKTNGYFTSIKPNGSNRPLRGDIVIWDGNGVGHIAVVAASTKNTISVYQQNYNTPTPTKPCSLDVVPWNLAGLYVKGWLRPMVDGATMPDPGEIEVGNSSGGYSPPSRRDDQRWMVADVGVHEAPRADSKKVGEIKAQELVTMEGYVLGEWFTHNGEGSSFWFKVKDAGPGSSSGSKAGFSGKMDWDLVAQRESSGNWACDTGNGFCGGLQFLPSTWDEFGGRKYAPCAHMATREQQIEIAEKVLAVQGPNAWPNTHQGAWFPDGDGPKGDGGSNTSQRAISGYIPFAFADPLETYGVPDITQYETWTTYIPNPPNLPANAPEAHWEGTTWQGWQWDASKSQVVWKTPSGQIYTGSYIAAGGQIEGGAYPEPIPTQGPVTVGQVSQSMYNYLVSQEGWGPVSTKPQDLTYMTLTYHEMFGDSEKRNTSAEGAWYWLLSHGWRPDRSPYDKAATIYAPTHPDFTTKTTSAYTPVEKPRYPILPGSDVTEHVAQVLKINSWYHKRMWDSDLWIVPPDGYTHIK